MFSTEYAHPESLVSTGWVAEHLNDPKVRIIESNEDVLLYDTVTFKELSMSIGGGT
jgi:thiosulfate/3-mercaptopyruvate sulfurtransferase